MEYRRKRNDDISEDSPKHSRLFVLCDRQLTEQQLRDAFCSYGHIEDVRMPRDHNTGELKGVAYIKFSKTSEAATALESMNTKTIPGSNRPLKVMVAANRSDIQSDDHDDERYKRLFININKSETEMSLRDYFSKFGSVESVAIQRNRATGEPQPGAYVKYQTFSDAARAFEECEKHYRAIFALPKVFNKRRNETAFESNINNLAATSTNMKTSLFSMMNTRPKGYTRVNFMCDPFLTQYLVEGLFDLVPGMVDCQYIVDLVRNCGHGTVSYSNPIAAAYAVDKLDKFEYPPGSRIFVKPDNGPFGHREHNFPSIPTAVNRLRKAIASTSNSPQPDLAQLAEAIAEASKLIKMATAGVSDDYVDSSDLNYCSVKLPSTQPLADIDSLVVKRCFLVCKPQPPPLTVLRDIFCRFGDLINVYTLPNKTVGYARYASAKGADAAIKTLHGAEICGVRIKVLEAEEEAPSKRTRYE